MENLFVVLTSGSDRSGIESSKISWLDEEDHIVLGDITIPELNFIGFSNDSGTSHKLNHRLYDFLRYYSDLFSDYDWITFIDDTSYVFKDKLNKELERNYGKRIPRLIGNDQITRSDHFSNNNMWKDDSKQMIFNIKTGISVNKTFLSKSKELFDSFTKKDKNTFLQDTMLDDRFFSVLSKSIDAKNHISSSRVYINLCKDIEENFDYYCLVGGLNAIDKIFIMENTA